jgi:hypothetical protein
LSSAGEQWASSGDLPHPIACNIKTVKLTFLGNQPQDNSPYPMLPGSLRLPPQAAHAIEIDTPMAAMEAYKDIPVR